MNLDKIDDVLSDYNTLNLHKLSKSEYDLIISDRTDLASTNSDSGQNYLYANSGEPLEIEPKMGKYNLYNNSVLNSTNYSIKNKSTVMRYKNLSKIKKITWDTINNDETILKGSGKYSFKYDIYPNIDGMTTNLQVTVGGDAKDYVTVTKKSDLEFEYEIKYTGTENTSFTLSCTDVSDSRIAYEPDPNVETSIQTINVIVNSETTVTLTATYVGPSLIYVTTKDTYVNLGEFVLDPSDIDTSEMTAEISADRVGNYDDTFTVKMIEGFKTKFQINVKGANGSVSGTSKITYTLKNKNKETVVSGIAAIAVNIVTAPSAS